MNLGQLIDPERVSKGTWDHAPRAPAPQPPMGKVQRSSNELVEQPAQVHVESVAGEATRTPRARLGQAGRSNLMQRIREVLAPMLVPIGHEEIAALLGGGFTEAQVSNAVANLRQVNDVVASGSYRNLKFQLTPIGRAKVPPQP